MMRAFWLKILRRSIPVAIALGIMGYVLAEVYLVLHRMNGGVPDPANEAVRWRTPLTMAGLGLALLAMLEGLAHMIRRKKSSEPPLANSTPESPVHKPTELGK